MPLTCEISGETGSEGFVATPSGHICLRRLILAKLSENGSKDPWHPQRPLSEDDLIDLQPSSSASSIVPPRNSHGIYQTLDTLRADYDAVILELFDTRKVLAETRQELAQALYQNDAAVRVIARLAAERDQARSQLQNWDASRPEQPSTKTNNNNSSNNKKAKREGISNVDAQIMLETWEKLQPTRKARQKEAAKRAVEPDQLKQFQLLSSAAAAMKDIQSKSVLCEHPTNNARQITTSIAAASSPNNIAMISYNCKELLIYDKSDASWKTLAELSCACPTSLDVDDTKAVVGFANGVIDVFDMISGQTRTRLEVSSGPILRVQCHPDNTHIVVATPSRIMIANASATSTTTPSSDDPSWVGEFHQDVITTGTLHPDGLIYLAADGSANLQIWDFKSQSLAGSLPASSPEQDGVVVAVQFSNNGYHIAAAHQSGLIRVWDLRKQKVIAELNRTSGVDPLKHIESVQFDDSGKYLAFSGGETLTVCISTVKEWDITAKWVAPDYGASHGLVWGDSWIASAAIQNTDNNAKQPTIVCFGL
jgi:pre-mRNA-processing factor 19